MQSDAQFYVKPAVTIYNEPLEDYYVYATKRCRAYV